MGVVSGGIHEPESAGAAGALSFLKKFHAEECKTQEYLDGDFLALGLSKDLKVKKGVLPWMDTAIKQRFFYPLSEIESTG